MTSRELSQTICALESPMASHVLRQRSSMTICELLARPSRMLTSPIQESDWSLSSQMFKLHSSTFQHTRSFSFTRSLELKANFTSYVVLFLATVLHHAVGVPCWASYAGLELVSWTSLVCMSIWMISLVGIMQTTLSSSEGN